MPVGPSSQTLTIDTPTVRALVDALMWFVPVRIIDGVLGLFNARPFATSFMSLLGWRQVFVVARKPLQ